MISKLFPFLQESPVSFLAIQAARRRLEAAGYQALDLTQPFLALQPGARIYVTQNNSALFAFHLGSQPLATHGFHLICAHSDSPTFRLKPQPEICASKHFVKLNVEQYGGAILSSWFDRPLSLAGRVILRGESPFKPRTELLHVKKPLLTIPNLCIHFNRSVNDGVKLSVQKDMQPILGFVTENLEKNETLLSIICEEFQTTPQEILDFDLYLYDTTPPCTLGLNEEFISASRLDDLEMVSAALEALIATSATQPQTTKVLAIFDNEETGSHTKQGAASPFFANFIQRLVLSQNGTLDNYFQALENAFMISADNAHGWHPNYPEKYDPVCYPILGKGPVIKFNAAQKYASDAESAAIFATLCQEANVPYQKFVNHSDVAGGSTLGNILTSNLPIRGVDMGNAIWAMHSVRETASTLDYTHTLNVFMHFYA